MLTWERDLGVHSCPKTQAGGYKSGKNKKTRMILTLDKEPPRITDTCD